MSITDELREWAHGFNDPWKRNEEMLLAIADRIDAAHEEAIASVMNDALYHANDKDMAELGWSRALDADKQPIKFGDEVEWRHPCGSCELRHGIVTGIKTDYVDGELFHEVTVNVDRFTVRLMASQLRHYHAPTVEDVLLDMHRRLSDVSELYDVDSDELEDEYTRIIEEFAAKLRLADDGKEQ